MRMHGRRTAAAAAVWLIGGAVASANGPDVGLDKLVEASSIIVHSRVMSVDYKMGPGRQGAQALPYAIVTYKVMKVIQGDPSTSTMKLRFVGGPDGRGGFVEASNVPVFQVGDEDVLFVQQSGAAGCALAGCVDGRYRVLRGAVYNGHGAPVRSASGEKISAGGATPAEFLTIKYPTPDFDELIKNPEAAALLRQKGMSIDDARREYKANSPAFIEMQGVERGGRATLDSGDGSVRKSTENAAEDGKPLSLDQFAAAIRTSAPASAKQFGGAPNFDPSTPLTAPSLIPMAPPRGAQQQMTVAPKSAEDANEENRLPKDDFSRTRNKTQ